MTVVTRQRSENFALIPNAVAEDERLSFEARGLLCYLLAKPNNWKVVIGDIQRAGKIGRDKAYRLLKELRDTGYVQLDVQRDAMQRIRSQRYVVYDCAVPERLPLPEKPEMANPVPEKPEVDEPLPEKPDPEKPDPANPDGIIRTQYTISPGHSDHAPVSDFDLFWKGFARQPEKHRAVAESRFNRLDPAMRRLAIDLSEIYCRTLHMRRQHPDALVYLETRAFLEFDGAPPLDQYGNFVIKPDRPEWPLWIKDIRVKNGEAGVNAVLRQQRVARKSRWPRDANGRPQDLERAHQQLSMEIG